MVTILLCLAILQTTPANQAQVPPPLVGLGQSVPDLPQSIVAHGSPFEAWPEGKAVMFVFFSVFSKPSLAALQAIEQQSEANKSIIVVGIAPNSVESIQSAIKGVGNDLAFPTLLADPTGAWKQAYLTPTGRTRLPVAVGVDRDRTIAWHGRAEPRSVGPPLAMLSANTWSQSLFAERVERSALRINNARRIGAARQAAATDGNHRRVLEVFDQAIQSDPQNSLVQADRFEYMIKDMNEPALGYAYAEEVAARFANDYVTLNDLAWRIASRARIETRDLTAAMSLCDRANALRSYRDYALLDTLARIYWLMGDGGRAIAWQRKAVALAPDSWHGDSTRQNLLTYENGEISPGTLPDRWVSPRQNR
jgi:tetratricopeptide (TPR) repeat protein